MGWSWELSPISMTIIDWLRSRDTANECFLTLAVICGLVTVSFHLAIHFLFEHLWGWASGMGGWKFKDPARVQSVVPVAFNAPLSAITPESPGMEWMNAATTLRKLLSYQRRAF